MPRLLSRPMIGFALLLLQMAAHANPACLQQGEVKAAPPLIPEAFRIHECSAFSGGKDAAEVGRLWCEQAGTVNFGPADTPPKVTRVDACPSGAIALCTAPLPGSSVVVKRYHYVADKGAGGMEGLRRMCEGRKKGSGAVFTVL